VRKVQIFRTVLTVLASGMWEIAPIVQTQPMSPTARIVLILQMLRTAQIAIILRMRQFVRTALTTHILALQIMLPARSTPPIALANTASVYQVSIIAILVKTLQILHFVRTVRMSLTVRTAKVASLPRILQIARIAHRVQISRTVLTVLASGMWEIAPIVQTQPM